MNESVITGCYPLLPVPHHDLVAGFVDGGHLYFGASTGRASTSIRKTTDVDIDVEVLDKRNN